MPSATSIQGQIEQLRRQVEAITQDRVTPAVTDFANRAGSAASRAGGTVKGQAQVVSDQVRGQPFAAILVAAAIGWIVARLLP